MKTLAASLRGEIWTTRPQWARHPTWQSMATSPPPGRQVRGKGLHQSRLHTCEPRAPDSRGEGVCVSRVKQGACQDCSHSLQQAHQSDFKPQAPSMQAPHAAGPSWAAPPAAKGTLISVHREGQMCLQQVPKTAGNHSITQQHVPATQTQGLLGLRPRDQRRKYVPSNVCDSRSGKPWKPPRSLPGSAGLRAMSSRGPGLNPGPQSLHCVPLSHFLGLKYE